MAAVVPDEAPYCLCEQPYAPGAFMIECEGCADWLHGACVQGVRECDAAAIAAYRCPRCAPPAGAITCACCG